MSRTSLVARGKASAPRILPVSDPSWPSLRGMPILVTGATGFIGRHLLKALVECGAGPWAVVRPGRERAVPTGTSLVTWDLREERPRSALPRRIAAVVHLAAPRNRALPEFGRFAPHIRITLDAGARVYEAARERGAAHVVAVSTIAVAGPHQQLLRRDTGVRFAAPPAHPYAVVKRWSEELAVSARAYVRHVTIVRPGPVYGPGQSSRFGLVQGFARHIDRGEPVSLAPPRGRLVSPVFVGDVVYMLMAALARPSNLTLTVGGPDAFRERTLVDDIARHLGRRVRVRHDTHERPGRFATDNSAVDRLFPGRPQTRWREGLRLTWRGLLGS